MGYLGLSTSLNMKAALLTMKYVYTQTHVASKWPGSKEPVRSLLPSAPDLLDFIFLNLLYLLTS